MLPLLAVLVQLALGIYVVNVLLDHVMSLQKSSSDRAIGEICPPLVYGEDSIEVKGHAVQFHDII